MVLAIGVKAQFEMAFAGDVTHSASLRSIAEGGTDGGVWDQERLSVPSLARSAD